jgi:hypothetical protein
LEKNMSDINSPSARSQASSVAFKALWITLGSLAVGFLLWYCFSKFGALYGLQMVVTLLRFASPTQGSIDWPDTI